MKVLRYCIILFELANYQIPRLFASAWKSTTNFEFQQIQWISFTWIKYHWLHKKGLTFDRIQYSTVAVSLFLPVFFSRGPVLTSFPLLNSSVGSSLLGLAKFENTCVSVLCCTTSSSINFQDHIKKNNYNRNNKIVYESTLPYSIPKQNKHPQLQPQEERECPKVE